MEFTHTRAAINPRAILALVAGVLLALVSLVVPALRFFYDYACLIGFFVAGLGYFLLKLRYKQIPHALPSAIDRIVR